LTLGEEEKAVIQKLNIILEKSPLAFTGTSFVFDFFHYQAH